MFILQAELYHDSEWADISKREFYDDILNEKKEFLLTYRTVPVRILLEVEHE